MRVAAIVLNSVTRDARVLKEADSLARAGHDVVIFGIRDNNDSEPETHRASGARVVRVAWKAHAYRLLARIFSAVGLLLGLAVALPGILIAAPLAEFIRDVTTSTLVSIAAVLIAAMVVLSAREVALRFHAGAAGMEAFEAAEAALSGAARARK